MMGEDIRTKFFEWQLKGIFSAFGSPKEGLFFLERTIQQRTETI